MGFLFFGITSFVYTFSGATFQTDDHEEGGRGRFQKIARKAVLFSQIGFTALAAVAVLVLLWKIVK